MDLETIEAEVRKCNKCELHKTRCKPVISRGNEAAKIMLIGEAPGKDEDEKGKPFVGKSGQLLDELLKRAGFNVENDIYICNVVKCRLTKDGKDRKPSADEVHACKKFLETQIEIIKPKIVILCGGTAINILGIQGKLTNIHGKCHEKDGIKMFSIYHPRASIKTDVKQKDINKIKEMYELCVKN
jgi:DNA polymerase